MLVGNKHHGELDCYRCAFYAAAAQFVKALLPGWEILPRTETQWKGFHKLRFGHHRIGIWVEDMPIDPMQAIAGNSPMHKEAILLVGDMIERGFFVTGDLRAWYYKGAEPTQNTLMISPNPAINGTKGNARISVRHNIVKIMAKYKGTGYRVVRTRYPNGLERFSKLADEDLVVFEEASQRCSNEDLANLPKPRGFDRADVEIDGVAISRRHWLRKAKVTGMASLLPTGAFQAEVANPLRKSVWFLIECSDVGFQSLHMAFNGHEWYELAGYERCRIKEVNSETKLAPLDKALLDQAVELWLAINLGDRA